MSTPDTYRPVRALSRGISVLRELNRLGSARPADLARATGIDRTTTYRLLATLDQLGLVRNSPSGDEFVLTDRVRGLSDGFTERDRTIGLVARHLGLLFQKVLWPTDFGTFEQGVMVIRETTHRFSPYSVHRAMVGRPLPLLTSALGRAALSGASPQHRATMLDVLHATRPGKSSMRGLTDLVDNIVSDYHRRGYAWSNGSDNGRVNAIALHVSLGGGDAAALNLVFFRSAMSIETAAERFLAHLRECVGQIETSLAA